VFIINNRFPYINHVVIRTQSKNRAHSEIKGGYSPLTRKETKFQRRNNKELHIEDIIIKPAIINKGIRFSEPISTKCKKLRDISFKPRDFKTHNITVKAEHKYFQFP